MAECARTVAFYDKKVFGAINEYWATAVWFIRAREFFAECLGTFVLVVSCLSLSYFCSEVMPQIIQFSSPSIIVGLM